MKAQFLLGILGSTLGLSIMNPFGLAILLLLVVGYLPIRDYPDLTPSTILFRLYLGYFGSLLSAGAGLLGTFLSRRRLGLGGAVLLGFGAFGLFSELIFVPALNYWMNGIVTYSVNGAMTAPEYFIVLSVVLPWTVILMVSGALALWSRFQRLRSDRVSQKKGTDGGSWVSSS